MAEFVRINYGEDTSQFIEFIDGARHLREDNEPVAKVAVLIHGGFWRGVYGLSLMNDLGLYLASRVDAVYNIEYRRLSGGGGWPNTFEDVVAAIQGVLADLKHQFSPKSHVKVFLVGHSAGGHLSTLANSYFTDQRLEGFDFFGVSLGGVLDLAIGFDEMIGDGVVGQFLGQVERPSEDLLALASPRHRLKGDEKVLIVTGGRDDVVPSSIARSYVQRANELGVDVEYVDFPNEDHMDLIDTSSRSIELVTDYLARR